MKDIPQLTSCSSLPNVMALVDESLKVNSPRRADSSDNLEQLSVRNSMISISSPCPTQHSDYSEPEDNKIDIEHELELERNDVPVFNHVDVEISTRILNSDDSTFLLEELEKKDNMLAMLTEGLREVLLSTILIRYYYLNLICSFCCLVAV